MTASFPDCPFHLINIGKYLQTNDVIIGVKYKYAELFNVRGKYCTSSKVRQEGRSANNSFYNQVTVIVNNDGNHVNVKLFGNGSVHLTGCKRIEEGREVMVILYSELQKYRQIYETRVLTLDENNVLLDEDNLIYGRMNQQVIGFKKTSSIYVLNNKEFNMDDATGNFVSVKMETGRKRSLLNMDGEVIGHTVLELLKARNKFYKSSNIYIDNATKLIYHNDNMVIGKISYNYSCGLIENKIPNQVMEIEYSCCPFVSKKYDLLPEADLDVNVNCINIVFNLYYKINRQRLHERLCKFGYLCKYKPETYSGVKLRFKVDRRNVGFKSSLEKGLCTCTTKCTCLNITFLIFQSGNVIATGFKTYEQIKLITSQFLSIMESMKDEVRKRVLTFDKQL